MLGNSKGIIWNFFDSFWDSLNGGSFGFGMSGILGISPRLFKLPKPKTGRYCSKDSPSTDLKFCDWGLELWFCCTVLLLCAPSTFSKSKASKQLLCSMCWWKAVKCRRGFAFGLFYTFVQWFLSAREHLLHSCNCVTVFILKFWDWGPGVERFEFCFYYILYFFALRFYICCVGTCEVAFYRPGCVKIRRCLGVNRVNCVNYNLQPCHFSQCCSHQDFGWTPRH